MTDNDSPFTRERNLSNRNFKKRGSAHARRRISTDSRSSLNSENAVPSDGSAMTPDDDPSLLDVRQKVQHFETLQADENILFKTGKYQTTATKSSYVPVYNTAHGAQPVRVLPVLLLPRSRRVDDDVGGGGDTLDGGDDKADGNVTSAVRRSRIVSSGVVLKVDSIDEERATGHEVDKFSSDSDDAAETQNVSDEFVLPELAEALEEGVTPTVQPGYNEPYVDAINLNVPELGLEDFGRVDKVRCSTASTVSAPPVLKRRSKKGRSISRQSTTSTVSYIEIVQRSTSDQPLAAQDISAPVTPLEQQQNQQSLAYEQGKDFTRNFRSTPRPRTEIINNDNNRHRGEIGKFSSFCYPQDNIVAEDDEYVEAELRTKSDKHVQPILDELIKTEETYVDNLWTGIENYGNIFTRKDLPVGLRGKKYVLLGNIEQLAEFHRDEFLPMLRRNRYDLKRLFDEFQLFIEENCFYGYVIFTMNKQRSLKLCDVYKNYFKLIQTQLDDKLGINSFLVQPIQRMARYPLLLNQFITTLFKYREYVSKALIESCCRLEKKLRILLTTTNESEVVNDIVDCNDFNVFYQGKFRKVSEFTVVDNTLRRSYRSKVFIFDKCIIYTEIKAKNLIFHGRYPCESIGIVAKQKSFILFYQQRKQQECEFHGDQQLIEQWLELIREMTNSFVQEEKQKLQEIYTRDNLHRKTSLNLYRDSNRFSSDSGIGNIWVMPKPEASDEAPARTTWYTAA